MPNSNNEITTTHNLDFTWRQWLAHEDMKLFQVGTCKGLWFAEPHKSYCIIAIDNSEPHNGHLEDVFEWFEHSCKRDGYSLKIFTVNEKFKNYLIEKRVFVDNGNGTLEKKFIKDENN